MELDIFNFGTKAQKVYYKDDYNFYKLYKQNFVVKDAIDQVAKRLSSANYFDVDEKSKPSILLNKINQPNTFQSKEEFLKDFAINILCSGYAMVWKKYKSFGVFETLELISISTDTDITGFGKSTVITEFNGKEEKIKIEDIIFFYDTQRQVDSLRGISRLTPLRLQINNIEDAQRAKNIQIQNSGTTIVSPKTSDQKNNMDDGLNAQVPTSMNGQKTQKEEMEDRLNNRSIERRIIVSAKGLDAKNLSAELNDMKFNEVVEADILAVYSSFGIPVELTPYGKNATYDNKATAENSLIESEVMPLQKSLTDSINLEFQVQGQIFVSYDHISSVAKTKNEFFKTKKEIAETYSSLYEKGLINEKEARNLLIKNDVI